MGTSRRYLIPRPETKSFIIQGTASSIAIKIIALVPLPPNPSPHMKITCGDRDFYFPSGHRERTMGLQAWAEGKTPVQQIQVIWNSLLPIQVNHLALLLRSDVSLPYPSYRHHLMDYYSAFPNWWLVCSDNTLNRPLQLHSHWRPHGQSFHLC